MPTQHLDTQLLSDARVSAILDEESPAASGNRAQRGFLQLSVVCYLVAGEIAKRRAAQFPGLHGHFSDRVLLVVGGQRTGALGTYAPDKWAYDERPFDEIHVNLGHDIYTGASAASVATDIIVTICHELVHLYARVNGVRDTSGRGSRYHNKHFAELAQGMELLVVRSSRSYIGHQTPGLAETGVRLYEDLIAQVEQELRLLPNFIPGDASCTEEPSASIGTELEVSKYVFAQCGCHNSQGRKRSFRMARGWWQVGTIGCAICKQIFTESPPERTNSADGS